MTIPASIRYLVFAALSVAGVFMPLQYQAVVLLAMLGGYAQCKSLGWPRYQQLMAVAVGGLCFGAGLQLLTGFFVMHMPGTAILTPLLFWLLTRMLFLELKQRFSLQPPAPPAAAPAQPEGARAAASSTATGAAATESAQGISAWSGAVGGATPDGALGWEYFDGGEIAMGGPTYGDVVFSNRFAFSGVGPSVAVSDDGRYAAMTIPSRNVWGLLLADFAQFKVYDISHSSLWEIDRIAGGRIMGRHSPLTSNSPQSVNIETCTRSGSELPLVNDDGWWLLDFPERKPLPRFTAVDVPGTYGAHRVHFEPDLAPLQRNPFTRLAAPDYAVSVDGIDLGLATRSTRAVWVTDSDASRRERFLLVDQRIFDFIDVASGAFDVQRRRELPLTDIDAFTHVWFGIAKAEAGTLVVDAVVMPRSTGFSDAEFDDISTTHPWDEEEVTVYRANGSHIKQQRERIQRYYRYSIDLPRYSEGGAIHACTRTELVNRRDESHRAQLEPLSRDPAARYSAYRCITSCGVDPGPVAHEAIWSDCGRYLAVLQYAAPPEVPGRIRIIDFKDASLRDIPGYFAMASFIWFERGLLELTHLVGVRESIIYGPGRYQETQIGLGDIPAKAASVFELLVSGIDARRRRVEQIAAQKASRADYASGSAILRAQHCALFGPEFDRPVLQPPVSN